MGKWSTMGPQLNVSVLDDLLGRAPQGNNILLNIQCGANLTLLGLHKQSHTGNIATKQLTIQIVKV